MPRQSAPKAAQSEFNPRVLMAKVMKATPTAGHDACLEKFEKFLGGPFEGYLHETVLYAGRLLYSYVRDNEVKDRAEARPPTPKQVAQEKAATAIAAKARVAELAPIMFLNLPTPFGKSLGELTGKEGRKLGGWMGEVFRGVPDRKTLADVKSQQQLKDLWLKHSH